MVKERREDINTYLAVLLIIIGIAFGWAGFYVEPVGDISGSVLGMIGECFTLAGALLGIAQYTSSKINKVRKDLGLKEEETL